MTRKIDIAILVSIFALLGVMIYFIIVITSEGTQCYASPLLYATKHYEEAVQSPLTCTCSFANPRYAPFIVSKEGFAPIEVESNKRTFPSLNFTLFNKSFVQ